MGRSPREIFKEVNAQEQKKKGVFAKSSHKKMMSSNQPKHLNLKKFRQITQTQEINSSQKNADRQREKTHSFKSETGEFGSVVKKDFPKMEYNTNVTGSCKGKRGEKGKRGAEKTGLDVVMPDCVSIYKKLDVHAIPKKGAPRRLKPARKDAKSRETTTGKKKELRGYSKVSKKRVSDRHKKKSLAQGPVQDSIKTTPERKETRGKFRQGSKTKAKSKSRDGTSQSKKARKKSSKGKSNGKGRSHKKPEASQEKKALTRKHTFQEKRGARPGSSTSKLQRLNRGKKPQTLNSKISQTMTMVERGSNEASSFHKRTLKSARPENSVKSRFREKSQKLGGHIKNKLKSKDQSRRKKAKVNHSLQKSLRQDESQEHLRGKKFRKNTKKKNSMMLKNLDDLRRGLNGDVKVIYKGGPEGKRKGGGIYTKSKYVYADLKQGVEGLAGAPRDSKMEMIYRQEQEGQVKGEVHFFRELPHIDANTHLRDETPNIYSNQKSLKTSQIGPEGEGETKAREGKCLGKFISLNEKRIRVSGFRKDPSSQKKPRIVSIRKLSTINKGEREKEGTLQRGYKSSLKNRLGQRREKAKHRDSLNRVGKERGRKSGSQSKLYSKKKAPALQGGKTNIYQKTGPEFSCPASEIEFEGKNVKNSIYIKSEEIQQDVGTTVSEKTENSLACQENIGKALEVSQSPEPVNGSMRRGRQSTKNPTRDQEGNTYFEIESGVMDYAKSEDLEGERRLGERGGVTSLETKEGVGLGVDLGKQGELGQKMKKMKMSQSEAGNWKSMVKSKFKGAKSGNLDLINQLRITSPELISSPQGPKALAGLPGNIYLQQTNSPNFDSNDLPPMEFEVDVPAKFESLGKGKSSSSNRTNKINYKVKKNSLGNFLGESEVTVGKQISPRKFGYKSREEAGLELKKAKESSEDEEDLIIGNSVTLEMEGRIDMNMDINMDMDIDMDMDGSLPLKDELEALESLSRDMPEKDRKENKGDNDNNYLTLKASTLLTSQLARNLSDRDVLHSDKKQMRSLHKWKPSKKGRRKVKAKGKQSRSNSKVKLYKMTSERNSALEGGKLKPANTSKIRNLSRAGKNRTGIKVKLSEKSSGRKQEISRLLEKYSREDNTIEKEPITPAPMPASFSSTFGTNLKNQIREAKKPVPKSRNKSANPAAMVLKCKQFKHETQSNLFEVETLNTLTRAEDDYVAKPEYLNLNQPFLDAKVRTVLMGWMGEVSEDLWFCRDTFHMACNYVDRYLQLSPKIAKDQLQLIGLTCLYIASKMEEVQMRNVNDYLSSACNIYTEENMMQCEIKIITVLDFRLNPPTLNLWANWYMNQWDNFLISDSFVQEHPMIQDSKIVAQFKQGNEESYNLYREFMQYLDCAVLDIQTLEYKQYLLVPAFMYIVLGMKYQQFSLEQIVEEFPTSSMYLLDEEEYAFNNLFGYFMYYYFGIELIDLLPTIQYASTYFYFSIELRLPSIIDYKRDEISDGHYEQFISYQIWNKKSVAYVAKLRIPEH